MEIIRRSAPRRAPIVFAIEPVEYKLKPVKKRVAIWDTETDPFEHGLVVKPFTCGLYFPDTEEYIDFWGDDCVAQFFKYLEHYHSEEELLIYAHNFGNFDAYFMTEYFDSGHKPFIINGRIVRCMARGHEFRDSYAMVPVALAVYDKIKFDYDLMQRWSVTCLQTRQEVMVRELYAPEIRHYQKRDCTSLGELVTGWLDMFGDRLTMAGAALGKSRAFHGFETLSEKIDDEIRPFYFGGRNQCFATGVLHGAFKVYDINSSYPDAMRRYQHPISDKPIHEPKITARTHFAKIRAWSLGALPIRKADGGLDFPIGVNDFFACIHEINAGLETGTLKILHTYYSIYFEQTTSMAEFVDTFYNLRLQADADGDGVKKLFYKLVLNSSYGKYAQDPRRYENWLFDPDEIPTPLMCETCHDRIKKGLDKLDCKACNTGLRSPYGWYLHTTHHGKHIYAQPQKLKAGSFFNVGTAASITSAARANLLRGIQAATRPVYCDTDSIICEHLEPSNGIVLDPKQLGAWDVEAEGDTVCIAGKKLYAIFKDGEEVKKASKGVKLTAREIERVCNGEVVEHKSIVPKFKLNGDVEFQTRNIKRTG